MYQQYFSSPATMLLSLVLFFSLMLPSEGLLSSAFAETEKSKKDIKKKSPIKITSETMKSFKNKNMVTFFTNVVVRKDDLTIFSDRLDLFTDKDNKQLTRVVATGGVRIEKEDMSGTSEKAIYDEAEKKITLLGNAVVIKDDNIIKGSRIVYFQEDESIVAESDANSRVEVTVFPEQLKKMKAESSE